VRALHEQGNDKHRVRVEHDRHTLFVHLSGEHGDGWTCLAVHRDTRQWAVGQADTQSAAAMAAYEALYPGP
jgi:hypothetical protein